MNANSKEIRIADVIAEDLNAAVKERQRTHKVFYASEVGYCPLRLFFSITFPARYDTRVLQVFKVGDLVHEYIQSLLREKYGADVEVPIREEIIQEKSIEMHGRVDVLVDDTPYELKTTAVLPTAPREHHIAQLTAYLHLLGVRKGYVVYVEKNTINVAQYPVRYDSALWETIVRKVETVHDAVEEYQRGGDWARAFEDVAPSWECRYCVHKQICIVGGDAGEG